MSDQGFVLIGAGSTVFTPGLLRDITLLRALRHVPELDPLVGDARTARAILDDAVLAHAPFLDSFRC
jgi:alpha-galactosidase